MKGSKLLSVALALATLLALSAGLSVAQGPAPQGPGPLQTMLGSAFTYQGQLLKDGNPVNDTCTMVFSLYDDESAGNLVGDPITQTVTVANGLFTTALNSGGEFGTDAFTGEARWLEVAVQCPGDPGFTTLAPRQELTAAPYALSLRPGALVEGDIDGHVLRAINQGEGSGLYGQSYATSNGHGVTGLASATSGTTYGVYGRSSSPDGYGVFGWNAADIGAANGVSGRSDSNGGVGVCGEATATTGATTGVYGRADSPAGRGVYGYASSSEGFPAGYPTGVYGEANSTTGYGVHGEALATTGGTRGVYGVTASIGGHGVHGLCIASTGDNAIGVYGESESTEGSGVYGVDRSTVGENYGVYGLTWSDAGYGVYSWGNFGATGTKAAIVQTQSYGWRHLYAMESPDVLFEDVGTAQLVDGQAVVTIDPIFAQTVNLEQPYQVFLTPQGEGPVLLWVTAKTASSFTVRGVTLDGIAASSPFDYRIIAKRLGYEGIRLAPASDPTLQLAPAESQP